MLTAKYLNLRHSSDLKDTPTYETPGAPNSIKIKTSGMTYMKLITNKDAIPL